MNLEQIKNLYTEEEIKKIKENSREIYMRAGEDLSNVVINLEKLRRQGKLNCYVNFNGKKIYSLDDLIHFVKNVCCNNDAYEDERMRINGILNPPKDNYSEILLKRFEII